MRIRRGYRYINKWRKSFFMYISCIEYFDSVFSQANFNNLINIFKDNKYLNLIFFITESKQLIQLIILSKLFFYLLMHRYSHLTLINLIFFVIVFKIWVFFQIRYYRFQKHFGYFWQFYSISYNMLRLCTEFIDETNKMLYIIILYFCWFTIYFILKKF